MSVYTENTPHPRPVEWFYERRGITTAFVKTIIAAADDGSTHIVINAPVKSGKKDIVEILRQLTNETVEYCTSLNRKDVKRQKLELNKYNIPVHIIDNDVHCREAITEIKTHTGTIYLCIDECDYGSGDSQKMAGLFKEFLNTPTVIKIYFSATSFETEASSLSDRPDYIYLKFTPPPEYHGAEYFLDEDLVIDDVDTFFDVDENDDIQLTEHGVIVIRESIKDDRHIGVVRVNNKIPMKDFKKEPIKEAIQNQLKAAMPEGLDWLVKNIDAELSHDWEDEIVCLGHTGMLGRKNILFIIKQTCTRGTDLKGWHHRLAFWHDARSHNGCSRPNTLIQAFLRPAHYGPPQAIRMYVDKLVMELAAYDDMEAWIKGGGKPPTRTKRESRHGYETSPMSFATTTDAKLYAQSMNFTASLLTLNTETLTFQYRGQPRAVQLENETRQSTDIGWGISHEKMAARIMPVLSNEDGTIRYLVNYPNLTEEGLPIHATQKSMYEY